MLEETNVMHWTKLKAMILADFSASFWLQIQLKDIDKRDCLDLLNDTELLYKILLARADESLGQSNGNVVLY